MNHSKETLYDMRQSIEKLKNQEFEDIRKVEEKIKDIHATIDPLPN